MQHLKCFSAIDCSHFNGLAPDLLKRGLRTFLSGRELYKMSIDSLGAVTSDWRAELPTLAARLVVLREPISQDVRSLVELLSLADACRFGLDEPVDDIVVQQFIARARQDRTTGMGFTFVVT